jgi:predicted dienelactone hydrolase
MTIAKKLGIGLLVVLGMLFAAVAWAVISSARTPARAVGAQQMLARDADHAQFPVLIFYPTTDKPRWKWLGTGAVKIAPNGAVDGERLPLVVLSHGTGGTPLSHIDTVLALAEAGYVVAAPIHSGDNLQDQSNVGTATWLGDRARQLRRTAHFITGQWPGRTHVDPAALGIFGYSAGGTAALINIGGQLDPAQVRGHCAAHPEFVCKILKPSAAAAPVARDPSDSRIKAAILVAPGLGFGFSRSSLSSVSVPVQLWAGTADTNVPPATNAALIRSALKVRPEFHSVPNASHFSFLPPCGAMKVLLPRMLCSDRRGFDRADFHRSFNREVVRYFDSTLRKS